MFVNLLNNMKTIIEHLEEELYSWCVLEYTHISKIVGKENLIITNIKQQDVDKIKHLAQIETKSIKELKRENMTICILDPFAKKKLIPEDSSKFTHFLFGGILGDHPMKKRTEKELTNFLKEYEARNIGDKQMSTDTAVLVCHKILDQKIPFNKLEFQDGIEIELEPGYSNQFPFRYLKENGKIVFTPGLKEFLKKQG